MKQSAIPMPSDFFVDLFLRIGSRIRLALAHGTPSRSRVDRKEGGEVVTQVDRDVERMIIDELSKRFPGDPIVAEESRQGTAVKSQGRTWFVDPIDGTRSLAGGLAGFSVMIGCTVNEIPCEGYIYSPMNGVLYWVASEHRILGYHESGRRTEVLDHTVSPQRKIIWNPYNISGVKEVLIRALDLDGSLEIESTGLRAVAFARGAGVLFASGVGTSMLWDTCAAHAFVRAVGGTYTDFEGNPLDYSSESKAHLLGAVATRNLDHVQACGILAKWREDQGNLV